MTFFLLLFLIGRTGPGVEVSESKKPVILGEADNEKTVRLAKGDELEIRLEAQLGTGYSWRVTKFDEHVLDRLGEPVVESSKGTKPGSREVQVFRYLAKAKGQAMLALEYARPWEKDKPAARRFRVSLRVR
jgi:inhibitor of cysteine peptidase